MDAETTRLEGVLLFKPRLFHDERGFFLQTYQREQYKALGIPFDFVQDNQSFSKKWVLRGLHLQKEEHAQSKLVSVPFGRVLDVAVDVRIDSPTFGQWVAYELSSENGHQLFIPRGFAHGFVTLSDEVVLAYKCDNYYNKGSECCLRADDKDLAIDWGIPFRKAIVSDKDLNDAITLEEFKRNHAKN